MVKNESVMEVKSVYLTKTYSFFSVYLQSYLNSNDSVLFLRMSEKH